MTFFKVRALLACGVAIAVLGAAGARAQETTVLEEVVVEGEGQQGGEDASGVGEVKGVVAKRTRTGSKSATEITEIPQSVSVVGREEIDDQGAQKADEALRYTAGVFSQPFGPDSDTNWFFIRGFQATATGTYLDGLQLFSYGFGGFYVDTFGLERIEVLKGAASVLYGGSNPGGIVNYVSKRPEFSRTRYVETGINDAGNAYLGFDIGDVANDTVALRMTGRVAGGETYSDDQDGWRGFISPSITWKPDEQTSLTILANYTHIDETHNGGSFLPYSGTVEDRVVGGVNYGRIRPDFNPTDMDIDKYEREQASVGYEFEHTFDSGWTVRSNARYGAADIQEVSVYPYGWDSADTLTLIDFAHDTRVSTFLADNQIEGKVEIGAVEHTLLGGIEYKYFNIDQVQESAFNARQINPFTGAVTGAPGDRMSYLNQDMTLSSIGLYAQDQLRFGDGWLVTLNGRYDWYRLETEDGPTDWGDPDVPHRERSGGAASGRAGLAYEFGNGVTPYASVATYFMPQIGVANDQLMEPEEGIQYEVGVKYAPTFLDAIFTVALFDLTRENVSYSIDNVAMSQFGKINSRGVELEAKVNVTEDFKLTGAFTAYDLTIREDENPAVVGKRPFIVPEVMASLSADYAFRGDAWYDGVSIGGGVRYVGSSWVDNENTLKVPDVTLVDLKLGYEKDNWGVDLNVTNVFDKTYVSSCQTEFTCGYGEGRSFKLKAHTSW